MIAWIPYSIIVLIQTFYNTEQLTFLVSKILVYLPYLQSLMLPFACILFIPEIKKKIFSIFQKVYFRQNQVGTNENSMETNNVFTVQK